MIEVRRKRRLVALDFRAKRIERPDRLLATSHADEGHGAAVPAGYRLLLLDPRLSQCKSFRRSRPRTLHTSGVTLGILRLGGEGCGGPARDCNNGRQELPHDPANSAMVASIVWICPGWDSRRSPCLSDD